MKVTYKKIDGRIFSVYTEKLSDMDMLLQDSNIVCIECFFVTQREKQAIINFFKKNYYVQNVDFVCSVRILKK